MKTKLFISFLMVFFLLISSEAFAQRGRRAPDLRLQQRQAERLYDHDRAGRPGQMPMQACLDIPGLTGEQQDQIRDLRLQQLERTTRHRSSMDELRAEKRSRMIGDDADIEAIHHLIDQMTELRNARLKENVEHRQAIRELLTDEQRVIFDSRTTRGPGRGTSMGQMGRHGRGAPQPMGRGRW